MKIEIINPITFAHWDEILLDHPDATIFHSSNWARVLYESYGYGPVFFAGFEQGVLKTLMPFMDVNSRLTGHRGVSLPFSDYCRLIHPEREDLSGLFAMIQRYGKKIGWKYFELRNDNKVPEAPRSSTIFYTHTLELSQGEEFLWKGLRNSNRRNIKKAINSGISVVNENSKEALRQFYRLNCLTRKTHGMPPQPFHFFEKLYEYILSNNFGYISLAYFGEKIVSGNIYLHFGPFAIYKYGASDKRYQLFRANNLLQWEAIRWYASRGYRQLCFGRTEPGNKGLLQFKRGWGADEKILAYHKYNFKEAAFVKDSNRIDILLKRLIGKMPLPILRLIGILFYSHMG